MSNKSTLQHLQFKNWPNMFILLGFWFWSQKLQLYLVKSLAWPFSICNRDRDHWFCDFLTLCPSSLCNLLVFLNTVLLSISWFFPLPQQFASASKVPPPDKWKKGAALVTTIPNCSSTSHKTSCEVLFQFLDILLKILVDAMLEINLASEEQRTKPSASGTRR